ncbi:hypothetical protein AALP_AAs68319U000200 [Arabis alpina]|uniref:Uncharacterized protein n=1 Tax=Arabis alpina TaxID=50452 RepID=A0A087G2N4_ARAAL|nr:hypothetical protein AALP_AAs68319U000200 [Arabis alpina]
MTLLILGDTERYEAVQSGTSDWCETLPTATGRKRSLRYGTYGYKSFESLYRCIDDGRIKIKLHEIEVPRCSYCSVSLIGIEDFRETLFSACFRVNC